MGKFYDAITSELADFIRAQHVYFVGTAPLAADGHVNVSPKGLDTFRVLAPDHVAYLDLTGSGSEVSAHLIENGRITIMFCAFEGPPRILRLYGEGQIVLPGTSQWDELRPLFPEVPGARLIVSVAVKRLQTSCGFGVPLFDNPRPREMLVRWAESKGENIERYRAEKNARSIDGLPTPFTPVASPGGGDG
ncbi:MAG TPA: pyridoxamine 5'-phosphate oxidase family protein [Longimicrobiales bacterium]|nr:pyridoxamine 5'-phosphate oxidase family protein [Longimicrobiales bacterium]